MILSLAQTEQFYEQAHPDLEHLEVCGEEFSAELAKAINAEGGEPPEEWKKVANAPLGASLPGGGKVLKKLPGAGKVYDWRDSSWTPVNGGRTKPLVFVQHIPVVPNVDGIADFVTLRNVLVAQGLMVQSATDREGNVALYTPFSSLCYQARGANQVATGCEHMHYLTSEDWTLKQLRAMAWLIQLAERSDNIPRTRGRLGQGSGVVRVLEAGQVWHSEVSDAAGYHDRSDPWGGTSRDKVIERWEYVQSAIKYFEDHDGSFIGA